MSDLAIIVSWGLLCSSHAAFSVWNVLHSSDDLDVYDKTVSYQVAMFGLSKFPIWLVALLLPQK